MGLTRLLRTPLWQDKVREEAHRHWDHLRSARPSPSPPESLTQGWILSLQRLQGRYNPVALVVRCGVCSTRVAPPAC